MRAMIQRLPDDPAAFFTIDPPAGDPPSMVNVDRGVATITVEGPMIRKPDAFARLFMGAIDTQAVADAVRQAGERPDVRAVLLDIDSPGGTITGIPELAASIRALDERKPVTAFTSGMMASAAYWLASQARAIYATPSSRVGSVGVSQVVIDQSDRIAKSGIRVEVFTVGKYKAMGHPAVPLTDDQRSLISDQLIEIAREFREGVLARGRQIPDDAMEGQTFSGRTAASSDVRMVTGTVPDRTEAERRLRVLASMAG